MIKFRCPNCQQKLGVPDKYAGRRVRCNKCSQPCDVPQPAVEAQAPQPEAQPQTENASEGIGAENMDFFSGLEGMEVQEDQRQEAIRAAGRDRSAKKTQTSASAPKPEATKKAKRAAREKSGRTPIGDMVPDFLRFPLSIVAGLAGIAIMIGIWIASARAASMALGFFALLVPVAGAGGLRIFAVERTFLLGLLGLMIGIGGIIGGKWAIAKHVVIPLCEKASTEECLVEMDELLANKKLQIRRGSSVKPYATDGDCALCFALFSLVDDDLADPIKVRGWTLHILRASNKTNVLEFFMDKISNSTESTRPELDAEGEEIFAKAYERLFEWEENKTALQNARKYFPALVTVANQCELLRKLEKPDEMMQFAFLKTLGLFDALWILLGMGLSFGLLALD
jgi:hypothetical protein